MKFACENCGTRYTLSDEKVRNRLLKIRCKICENVIVISGQGAEGGIPTEPSAEVEWFCSRAGGDPDGPMPEERLKEKVRRGELTAGDLVWAESLSRWTPLGEVPVLKALLPIRRETEVGIGLAPEVRPTGPGTARGPVKLPGLPPGLAARAAQSRGMPAPLPPPGGGLITPPSAPPPKAKEADTTEAMSDLPAGLVGMAARLVDDGRETGVWQPGPERETVSVVPDPALLVAAGGAPRALDTVQAPILEDATLAEEGGSDTLLAPVVPPGATEQLALLTPAPVPATTPTRPISDPPAPMVLLPPPRPAVPAVGLEDDIRLTEAQSEERRQRAQAPTVPAPAPAAAPRLTQPSEKIEETPPDDLDQAFFGGARVPVAERPRPEASGGRSWLGLVIGGLVLLGGGLGIGLYFGRHDAPTDPTLGAVGAVADAARMPPDASKAVDAAVPDAAVPDAAVPDAAVLDAAVPDAAAPATVARPSRPRAPASTPVAPVTEAASGALAALDRGRAEAPVELPPAVDTTPLADLPDTLDQAAIVSVIKGHQRGVHGCYQRQLKRDPSMRQANVKLAFSIERSGLTSNVRIDEKYADTELATCLDRLVRRWRFPAFRGEAIPVEYPLIFTASP